MQKLMKERLRELKVRQKRRRQMGIIAAFFGVIVIGGVVWGMTRPGVAMTGEAKCGIEEHKHSDKCYENVLVCKEKESEGHKHDDSCYKTEEVLVCDKEEAEANPEEGIEGHKHDKGCYEEKKELVCKEEESKGHTHSDKCYKKELVCGKEEHTHEESCYVDEKADVEKKSDWDKQYKGVNWKDAWGEDLVTAADKQVGYKESTDNYKKVSGDHKGYTRYGDFAGEAYADWDAAFVNFCLHYAGIAKSDAFPDVTDTNKWYNKFNKVNGSFLAAPDGYEPEKGDIVFFEKKKGETEFAMGIVSSSDKDKKSIKVIEGNVDNEVKEQKYSTGDSQIFAYIKVTELEKAFKGTAEEEKTEEENAEEAEDAAAEDPEAVETEETQEETEDSRFMQEAETENYIVTVRYGHDAELHKGAKLKVIEYAPDSAEYKEKAAEMENPPEWVLDIGFYVGKKEVEPQAEVSVTVKSKTADAAEAEEDDTKYEYNILHYGEEGTEQVGEVSQSEEDGSTVTTFTTNSFSTFSLRKDPVQTYGVVTPAQPEESILRGDDIRYFQNDGNGGNLWQIVDGKYPYAGNFQEGSDSITSGNRPENKIRPTTEPVRLQKNVMPTEVENEFLVYLSVDTKASIENYFTSETFQIRPTNSVHDVPLGTWLDRLPSTDKQGVVIEEGAAKPEWAKKGCEVKIIREGTDEVLASMHAWWDAMDNCTFYLKANGMYMVTGVTLKNNQPNKLILSDSLIEEIFRDKSTRVPLVSVTDEMGSYIDYLECVKPQSADVEIDETGSNEVLTWTLGETGVKERPVVKVDPDTGEWWALNVAELVYRVRLDVTKDGFESCAQTINNPKASRDYDVNTSATLTYQVKTTDNGTTSTVEKTAPFPVPTVRGLLYDVTFKKVGTNGLEDCEPWPLEGAEFTLTGTSGTKDYFSGYKINVSEKATSDEDGTVTFRGVPWSANYTIAETKAPDGYEKIESPVKITLCHTTDRIIEEPKRELKVVVDDCKDMVYKWPGEYTDDEGVLQGVLTVKNIAKDDFTFEKIWNDRDDELEKRPGSLTVTLVPTIVKEATQDGEPGEEMSDEVAKKYIPGEVEFTIDIKLTGGKWTHTWNDLPTRTNDNEPIRWIVKEIKKVDGEKVSTVPDGYVIADQWYKKIQSEESSGDGEVSPDAGNEDPKYDYSYYYIENRLKDEWQIVKKSSSEGGSVVKLEGAEFTLTAVPPELKKTAQIQSLAGKSDENGIIQWYEDQTYEQPFKGNISGLDGTYELTETKAPVGYRVSADVWKVTFDNGFLTKVMLGDREISSDSKDSIYDRETGLHTYVYIFENDAVYELPSTGGKGVYLYMFGGLLLMAGGLLMTYKNRRRGVLES